MVYTKKYFEENRDSINTKRRSKYSSVVRKADYQKNKDVISQLGKEDVKQCPICTIDFRRTYLRKHMLNRHKLSENQLPTNLCLKITPDSKL